MKVIDKLNEIKGSDATIKDIIQWAYMNRIPLEDIEESLELEKGEFPQGYNSLIKTICHIEPDEVKRFELFLNTEVE